MLILNVILFPPAPLPILPGLILQDMTLADQVDVAGYKGAEDSFDMPFSNMLFMLHPKSWRMWSPNVCFPCNLAPYHHAQLPQPHCTERTPHSWKHLHLLGLHHDYMATVCFVFLYAFDCPPRYLWQLRRQKQRWPTLDLGGGLKPRVTMTGGWQSMPRWGSIVLYQVTCLYVGSIGCWSKLRET